MLTSNKLQNKNPYYIENEGSQMDLLMTTNRDLRVIVLPQTLIWNPHYNWHMKD